MDISNKKLKKALEHYKNGEYESALKICEKFLEKEYSNEEALALEGDILYKLGRIDDAIVTWKINSEYNNNEEATQRLASVDKERKELALSYTSIQNMSSEDRILLENAYRENIELKKQVENSDLLKDSSATEEKSLNVETAATTENIVDEVATSNIKDFESHTTPVDELHQDYSSKILPLDDINNQEKEPKEYHVVETNLEDIIEQSSTSSNEPEAIDLEDFKTRIQHLEEEDNSKNSTKDDTDTKVDAILSSNTNTAKSSNGMSSSKKKAMLATSAAVIAIIVVALSYNKLHSNKTAVDNSANIKKTDTATPAKTEKPAPTTNASTADTTKLNEAQANQLVSDLQYLISANSIDGVNNVLIKTPQSVVPESAMAEYNKAENFMKTDGIEYYYTNGMNAYNNNDYLTAIDYFKKAQPYAKDDFRGPTMLFLTAVSYEKLGDTNNAVAAYKNYIATYPDAPSYVPESLYFLANYYSKNNNPTEAKQYATELSTKYPQSMYNNDNIKAILK